MLYFNAVCVYSSVMRTYKCTLRIPIQCTDAQSSAGCAAFRVCLFSHASIVVYVCEAQVPLFICNTLSFFQYIRKSTRVSRYTLYVRFGSVMARTIYMCTVYKHVQCTLYTHSTKYITQWKEVITLNSSQAMPAELMTILFFIIFMCTFFCWLIAARNNWFHSLFISFCSKSQLKSIERFRLTKRIRSYESYVRDNDIAYENRAVW